MQNLDPRCTYVQTWVKNSWLLFVLSAGRLADRRLHANEKVSKGARPCIRLGYCSSKLAAYQIRERGSTTLAPLEFFFQQAPEPQKPLCNHLLK
jgi:hypothetical protein